MAITTTVTVGSSEYGSVVVTSGQLSGTSGRQITLTAQPVPGYKLARWEIQTTPVELNVFAAVASRPVQSIAEVCGTILSPSSFQNVAVELYTDGTMLYLNPDGTTPAPYGYWGAGNNTYYLWTGGRLPALTQCTYEGGGGTGGGTGGGGGGGSICYDEFGQAFLCDGTKQFE